MENGKHKQMLDVLNNLTDEELKSISAEVKAMNLGGVTIEEYIGYFDKSVFDSLDVKKAEYVIGVDTYDKDALAYCLGRRVDGVFETLLSRTMSNESEFNQEVQNIAKYFNAEIISDKD